MASYELGPFSFIRMSPVGERGAIPPGLQQMTEILQRPGVNDSGIALLGNKGRPFQMLTAVDENNEVNCHDLAALYRASVGAGKLRLVYANIDYELAYNLSYVVLDLGPVSVTRLGAASGGLSTSKGAFIFANWTLLPVFA